MKSYIMVENPKKLTTRKIREKLKEKNIVKDIRHLDESFEVYAHDLKHIIKTVNKCIKPFTKHVAMSCLMSCMDFVVNKNWEIREVSEELTDKMVSKNFDVFEVID